MSDLPQVYIDERRRKGGSKSYQVRWHSPATGQHGCLTVRDGRRAEYEKARILKELTDGTYQDVQRISWADFAKDDVSKIKGINHRNKTKKALSRFGEVCKPASPRRVTFAMLESFVARLEADDLEPPTINLYLRNLRASLNRAIRRGYLARNPFDTSLFLAEEEKAPRVISDAEEAAILKAGEELYGLRWWALIHVALNTGGRNYSELLPLLWDHIELGGDDSSLHLSKTKGHCDRIIPIHAETREVLLRLKVQTLQAGGPFVGMHNNLERKWERIKKAAEVDPAIKMHDLRRTYVTRLIRAHVPLPTVQKLAGHKDIKTTLTFYNWVSMDDRREAVEKLHRRHSAG